LGCKCKTTGNRIKTRSPAETRPCFPSALDASLSVRSRILRFAFFPREQLRDAEELPLPPSAISHSPASHSPDASSITGGDELATMPDTKIGQNVKSHYPPWLAGSARGGSRLLARNGISRSDSRPKYEKSCFSEQFVLALRLNGVENSMGSRVEDSRAGLTAGRTISRGPEEACTRI